MKSIIEASAMTNFNLTDHQALVLIRAYNAQSPEAALTDTSIDEKTVAARMTLVHAGMLYMTETTLEVTEQGRELMVDENLIDEEGNLTDYAQKLVSTETENDPLASPQPPMESFALISEVNNRVKIQECDD